MKQDDINKITKILKYFKKNHIKIKTDPRVNKIIPYFYGPKEKKEKSALALKKGIKILKQFNKNKRELVLAIRDISLDMERRDKKFCPRNDIKDDLLIWKNLLKVVYEKIPHLYAPLYHFRVMGAVLNIKHDGGIQWSFSEKEKHYTEKYFNDHYIEYIKPFEKQIQELLRVKKNKRVS